MPIGLADDLAIDPAESGGLGGESCRDEEKKRQYNTLRFHGYIFPVRVRCDGGLLR